MKVICKGAMYKKYRECTPKYCYHAKPHKENEYCDCSRSIKGNTPKHFKEDSINCLEYKCVSLDSLEYCMIKVLEKDKE